MRRSITALTTGCASVNMLCKVILCFGAAGGADASAAASLAALVALEAAPETALEALEAADFAEEAAAATGFAVVAAWLIAGTLINNAQAPIRAVRDLNFLCSSMFRQFLFVEPIMSTCASS